MRTLGRMLVPIVGAGIATLVSNLLEPVTDRAWAPAILPVIVLATWVAGTMGGITALVLGFAGRAVSIAPYPWTRPAWMTTWLCLHSVAIVVTEMSRRARVDRVESRQIRRTQAARSAQAVEARRAEFLAHASDVLASSPNYATTLAAVANLAVPQIADLCVVDIVDENGVYVPVAIAHVDPAKVDLVRELRRLYPLDPKAPFGPPRVLRTGQSVVYPELPDSATTEAAIQTSEFRVARALGIRSAMAVPLLVGGRRLGVISLATTDSGRTFVASDVQFAESLARRAVIAIDTARP